MPRQITLEDGDAEFLGQFLYDQAEGVLPGAAQETLNRLVRLLRLPEESEWDIEIMRSIAPRKTYRVSAPDEELAAQRALELACNDDWTGAEHGEPDYEVDGVRQIAPGVERLYWTAERIQLWLPKFAAAAKNAGYDEITHRIENAALRIDATADGRSRVIAGKALADYLVVTGANCEQLHHIHKGWRLVFTVPVVTMTYRGSLAIDLQLTVK